MIIRFLNGEYEIFPLILCCEVFFMYNVLVYFWKYYFRFVFYNGFLWILVNIG